MQKNLEKKVTDFSNFQVEDILNYKKIEFINLSLLSTMLSLAFFLLLSPGNVDDKSFYFSTSNLGFLNSDYLEKRQELLNNVLSQCADETCQFRVSERITAFSNYPLYSVVVNFFYKIFLSQSELLKSVSYSYYFGFIFFFFLGLCLMTSLTFKEIESHSDYNAGLIFMTALLLYSGLGLGVEYLGSLFPNINETKYVSTIYVPRGPQTFFYVIGLYALLTFRHKTFLFTLLFVTFLNVGQAPFYLLTYFFIIGLSAWDEMKISKTQLTLFIVVGVLGLFSAAWTLVHYSATSASDVFKGFNALNYLNWNLVIRSWFLMALFLFYLFDKKSNRQKYLLLFGGTLFIFIELFNFIKFGITSGGVNQSSLEQLPLRVGTTLYTGLTALVLASLFEYLKWSRKKVGLALLILNLTVSLLFIAHHKNLNIKISKNLKGIGSDLILEYEKSNYPLNEHESLSITNLRPKEEVLFNFYMYKYFKN